jgi:hypothetical protein
MEINRELVSAPVHWALPNALSKEPRETLEGRNVNFLMISVLRLNAVLIIQ